MKEVKAWLVQEFLGYGDRGDGTFSGRVDGREWSKCRCGARMELKTDATGTQYLNHPKGISADKAHKRGMAHHSVYGSIQAKVADKVIDHYVSEIDTLWSDLRHMPAREIHDKYHNPMQCWFVCDYGDDRSYD